MSEKTEKVITKLDVVKTEHDLICDWLNRMSVLMDEHVKINSDEVLSYINGVRTMAEAMMDILADEDTDSDE